MIERLLNLVAFLLTAGRPATADEIRATVAGYGGSSRAAFHRMFERDKVLLRSIGIPIEVRETGGWEVRSGYAIDPEAYRLPDPGLTDEERAALALAARVVRLGGQAAGLEALAKLGGSAPSGGVEPLGADLGLAADRLGDLFGAVVERRHIRFNYRRRSRSLDPYGLGHRRGHWYLVGESGEGVKVFRVDRVTDVEVDREPGTFERPAAFDLRAELDAAPWEVGPDERTIARVRFEPELAWWAGRVLHVAAPEPGEPLEVELPVSNVDAFVGWLLSMGDAAEVLAPAHLRRQLVERIEAAL